MKVKVYIAASLDGFIAGANGEMDWLYNIPNPENSDFGFAEFMQTVDAVLMGRKTFQAIESFPEWAYTKPVFVWSDSLMVLPEKFNSAAQIIRGDIDSVLLHLQQKGVNSLYVDGGTTIQSFFKKGLIDELTITHIPIVLGNGIPLFASDTNEFHFEHVKTEVLNNSLVKSTYRR